VEKKIETYIESVAVSIEHVSHWNQGLWIKGLLIVGNEAIVVLLAGSGTLGFHVECIGQDDGAHAVSPGQEHVVGQGFAGGRVLEEVRVSLNDGEQIGPELLVGVGFANLLHQRTGLQGREFLVGPEHGGVEGGREKGEVGGPW